MDSSKFRSSKDSKNPLVIGRTAIIAVDLLNSLFL
jgi:hypothetical protein